MRICGRCNNLKSDDCFKTINSKHCIKCRERDRSWRNNNVEKILMRRKQIYQFQKSIISERKKIKSKVLKKTIVDHYGGKCICPLCDEQQLDFLTIDHIDGGGTKQRKNTSIHGGTNFYYWIIKNDYPSNLQIMCLNCNVSRHILGQCEHLVK